MWNSSPVPHSLFGLSPVPWIFFDDRFADCASSRCCWSITDPVRKVLRLAADGIFLARLAVFFTSVHPRSSLSHLFMHRKGRPPPRQQQRTVSIGPLRSRQSMKYHAEVISCQTHATIQPVQNISVKFQEMLWSIVLLVKQMAYPSSRGTVYEQRQELFLHCTGRVAR